MVIGPNPLRHGLSRHMFAGSMPAHDLAAAEDEIRRAYRGLFGREPDDPQLIRAAAHQLLNDSKDLPR